MENLLYAVVCALLVSAVSLVGIATFSFSGLRLKKLINLLLSLAAGAMLGNALLHMLPHALEHASHKEPVLVVSPVLSASDAKPGPGVALSSEPTPSVHEHEDGEHKNEHEKDHDHDHHADEHKHQDHPVASAPHDHDHDAVASTGAHDGHEEHEHAGLWVISVLLAGFLALFGLDLILLSRMRDDSAGVKPLGYLVLLSDGLENFMDGLVIGAAFLINVPAGIATTIAIFLHELPMELGDFAVLTHAGFSRKKALLLNLASALVNVIGVVLAFVLGTTLSGFTSFATPFAAGAILYLAAAGLLPQIRMQGNGWQKLTYFAMTLVGVALMALILLLE